MGKFLEGVGEGLNLYVRQVAWLNAAPPPRKANEKPPPPPAPTRRARIEKQGDDLPLPECPADYIVEWLFEVGPVMAGGMGPAPITWQELQAWQAATGIELQPWESRLLMTLSREFAAESAAAQNEDRPAPYLTRLGDGQRAAIARQVSIEMRALAAAQRETKAPPKARRKKAPPA